MMMTLRYHPIGKRLTPGAGGYLLGGLLNMMGLFASAAHATGFEPLPIDGVPLENGKSAYILCNDTGKFDPASHHDIPHKPTPSNSNTCAVFPDREIVAPLPDFSLVKHASRQALMNNALTGHQDKKVASVMDFVWRNPAAGECIYGTKVLALSSKDADYNTQLAGKQFFKISDIARGGFAGQALEVAYTVYSSSAEPVYRIGRSFTSVQYRKHAGFQRQPPIEPAYHRAINGVESKQRVAPDPGQQSASLNDNWVNFTTSVGLTKRPASPTLYIKARCGDETPVELSGAIRLRQTMPPFIELSVPGFAPPGATLDEIPEHETAKP
ncbi:hypothetical protein LG198_01155 [Methylobacillus arboreus]|uniref:hypothetical protein n=1 Tax=Methylobacillus arboreus TaxID=755170 RepID=UPI001E36716A|nr:hypothetical protein [Methylobacillus arboreus]MCB5189336.1 hypothetical protein [Methylobacillus arboreus]